MKKEKIIYYIFNLITFVLTSNIDYDCDLTNNKPDALSAYTRAQTNECKQNISFLTCNYQSISDSFKFKTKCTKSTRKHLVSWSLYAQN